MNILLIWKKRNVCQYISIKLRCSLNVPLDVTCREANDILYFFLFLLIFIYLGSYVPEHSKTNGVVDNFWSICSIQCLTHTHTNILLTELNPWNHVYSKTVFPVTADWKRSPTSSARCWPVLSFFLEFGIGMRNIRLY